MAFSTGWLLDKLGQKIYAWSTTNSVMDFDRGGETGQTLQKTLDDLERSKGDMRKDVFATNGKPGVVDNAINGINTYIHSKQGAVHNFQGEGSNGKALMTANFEEGDSITVNGAPVTAYIGTDEAVASMAGNEWNGKWITFVFDGTTLNFEGGDGLTAADKERLIPENIRAGVTIAKVTGTLTWKDLLPDNVDIVGDGIIQSNTYEGSAKSGDTAVSFKCLPAFDVTKYSAVMFSNCTCTGMHSAGSFKSGYCFIEDQTGKRLAIAPQNGAIDLKSVSGFIYFGFGGTVSNAWQANTPYKLTIGGLTLTEI